MNRLPELLGKRGPRGHGRLRSVVAKTLFPDMKNLRLYEDASRAFARSDAHVRSAQCLVAIRRWQIAHNGANPPDLASACREAKLSAVPVDPFSEGQPLRMTMLDGRTVVYSIGPDGVDDRASIDADLGRKPKGDFLFRLPSPR